MATNTASRNAGLSKDQLDVIEQFEADYNKIDRFLRHSLGSEASASFTHLVRVFAQRHAGWPDRELLGLVAEVRNAIVHGKLEAYRYVAIPAPAIMEQLRACRDRLMHPALAIPTFARKVQTVLIDESLAHVLKVINQQQYSQFPVYEDNRFQGLLTENGLTRWLAHHVATNLTLVELEDVPVREVLRNEEKRKTYHFVARGCRVDDLKALFALYELLEAVLITSTGKEFEGLLGIATRWDVLSET